MKVQMTNTEIETITSQIDTILPMAQEVLEIRECTAEDIIDEVLYALGATFDENNNVEIEIPEEKVIAYFDILSSIYGLMFKVAKIVKPTVELIMSDCKDDFTALVEKIENFHSN
jgi:hypothetical protein